MEQSVFESLPKLKARIKQIVGGHGAPKDIISLVEQARFKTVRLLEEQHLPGNTANWVGQGLESYFELALVAKTKHIQRMNWLVESLKQMKSGRDIDTWIEDGGIKTETSFLRKTNHVRGVSANRDISRMRVVCKDLSTLLTVSNHISIRTHRDSEVACLYERNAYHQPTKGKSKFAGLFFYLCDRSSVNNDTLSDENIEVEFEGIMSQIKQLESIIQKKEWEYAKEGKVYIPSPQEKQKLISLDSYRIRVIKRRNKKESIDIETHAAFDTPTEIQLITARMRSVMEENREDYATGKIRKKVSNAEYDQLMETAIHLDWKEYVENTR